MTGRLAMKYRFINAHGFYILVDFLAGQADR